MRNDGSQQTAAQVHIGDALNRFDGVDKVTGRAKYAADWPAPDLLYGWVVSSPIARGRITQIEDGAARAVPGVVEVITHRNRPHLPFLDRSYEEAGAPPGSPLRPLYDDKILFAMQPVAMVLAQTLEAAREAAGLVIVHVAPEAHNVDFKRAMNEKIAAKTGHGPEALRSRGDAQAAFDAAPRKHTARYEMATHHHNPMEMHASTVIWEGGGRITVHDKTQSGQQVQAYLASVFGFSKRNIRVKNAFVGGAFGASLRPGYQVYLATLAARMLRRSVRVVMTRAQMFSHVHRPQAQQTISLATHGGGRLQAIVNDATTATSRHEDYTEPVCNWGLMNYACENASGTYTIAPMDIPTPGSMRAPGAATGMTLFEMAVDEMACAVGLDPLEMRLLNYSDRDAMGDRPFSSKALRECYAAAAERFGWAARTPMPRSMRDGAEMVGYGMATGMWAALFMKSSAKVALDRAGRLTVSSAVSDIGTGTCTVMAQVAADALALPLERIDVRLGDTDLPPAPVQGGSWTAASTGAAVHAACETLRGKLFEAALKIKGGPLGEVKRQDVEFVNGHIVVRDDWAARVSLDDALAAALAGSDKTALEAEETVKPGMANLLSMALPSLGKAHNTHSAIFAEVRVDEALARVRVKRVVIAVAAGRIVNPKAARSQILGSVVMGIGMALHEASLMDTQLGRIVNHSFAEYHVPTQADVDEIEVIFVDEPDEDVSPLGIKGVGEIGIVGTAAAIANAIFHATGRRHRSLPITAEKLV